MFVTCPNCAADYEVPERLFRSVRRKVRCARCAVEFVATEQPRMPGPPGPFTLEQSLAAREVEQLPADFPEEMELAFQPAPHPRHRSVPMLQAACALLAWVASLGMAGGLGFAAIAHREAVMHAWAPSQRAYRALGLAEGGLAEGSLAEIRVVSTASGTTPGAARTAAPAVPATSPKVSPPG
jgi:predicted Zn finger-like uncharacterized protein